MPNKDSQKALVLSFYWDYIYNMPGHILKRDEYMLVEKALDCLYGSTCLIPYPDYLKMGKLHIGEMTEVLDRVKVNEEVLAVYDKRITDNDVLIEDNIRRLDEAESRVTDIENTKVVKGKNHIQNIPDIDLSQYDQIND